MWVDSDVRHGDGYDFYPDDEGYRDWNDWAQEEWDNGAVLHYDPEEYGSATGLGHSVQPEIPPLPRPGPSRAVDERVQGATSDAGVAIEEVTRNEHNLQPAAPKRKRGRPRKDSVDEEGNVRRKGVSQEELDTKLKEAVLADEALHHRILRYEASCSPRRAPITGVN